MNLDYDDWLENDNLDRDFWVKHYERWAQFWDNQEKEGLKNLSMAMAPLLGKLPQEVDEKIITEQDNTSQIKSLVKLRNICHRAYIFVMLFFIFALLTITLGFIII
ncbi:MAG: hypothetical protein ACNI3C_07760 [Candidatus Marinarcus sp.]|uniref:hypothetical protein n=1 Tax=Candidatus Marinarcus sp. TaxID=3100987 RepID=UPI003B009B33